MRSQPVTNRYLIYCMAQDSAESMAERKFIRQLLRNSRETLEQVEKNVEAGAVFSGFSERL